MRSAGLHVTRHLDPAVSRLAGLTPVRFGLRPTARAIREAGWFRRKLLDAPATQVLVEGGGVAEHVAHVGDIAVVLPSNVLVEGGVVAGHVDHVDIVAAVTTANIMVEGD